MIKKPIKTDFFSWKLKNNGIARGCKLCVQGKKLVLVVTGICADKCYYCPLSDQKKGKDIVWANEWRDASIKDVLEEARLTEAEGAGITGGDPLLRLNRTIKFIKLFKRKFGKQFHIHLYTPLTLVTFEKLKRLHAAGLDEIRFHPFLDKPADWSKIELATAPGYNWDVGIEIPVIPGKYNEMLRMILYFEPKIKFLNLNELEISDANSNKLVKLGFRTKEYLSYGVKGSEQAALKILKALAKRKSSLRVHYCTAQLKDRAQLRNRLLRRAKNAALKTDLITEEGNLIRGAVYLKGLAPGMNYRKRLEQIKSSSKKTKLVMESLKKARSKIIYIMNACKAKSIYFDKHLNAHLNAHLNVHLDAQKFRLLMNSEVLEEISKDIKKKGLMPAIVEEYPTWDAMEVEVVFI